MSMLLLQAHVCVWTVDVHMEQSLLFIGQYVTDTLKSAHGKGLPWSLSSQDHNSPNEDLVAVEPLYHKCK